MKKFFSIILIFLSLFFLLLPQKVNSQDLNQILNEYISSNSKFKTDYGDFSLARSKYLSYKTITAELEALQAARKMMITRSELIKNYILLLRAKLAAETGIIDYRENLLYIQLDNQATLNLSSVEKILSSKSSDELSEVEKNLSKNYQETQKLAFKSLATINHKKMVKVINNFKEQLQLLKKKVEEISLSSDYDFSLIQGRITELEKKITSVETRLNVEIKNTLNQLDGTEGQENSLLQMDKSLAGFKQELSGFSPIIEEIIISLKKI